MHIYAAGPLLGQGQLMGHHCTCIIHIFILQNNTGNQNLELVIEKEEWSDEIGGTNVWSSVRCWKQRELHCDAHCPLLHQLGGIEFPECWCTLFCCQRGLQHSHPRAQSCHVTHTCLSLRHDGDIVLLRERRHSSPTKPSTHQNP